MASENKNVFLYGYFGASNYGDELILMAFLKQYLKHKAACRLPENIIAATAIQKNPFLETFKNEFQNSNISFVRRSKNPFSFLNINLLKKSEYLVFPGGGVFQDYGVMSFLCYFTFALAFKLFHKKVFLLYQGFTGVKKSFFQELTRFMTSKLCDYLSIRDKASLKYIPKYGLNNSKIYADAVFLLNAEIKEITKSQTAISYESPESYKEKTAGISLRGWPGINEYSFAGLIKNIIKATGFKIILYSMQKDSDCALNVKIYDELKKDKNFNSEYPDKVEIYEFEPDYKKFIGSLSKNYVNLGMRFHFSVLSVMAGVPALGLSYDDKILNLYRELNFSELCIDISEKHTNAKHTRNEFTDINKISDELLIKLKTLIHNYDAIIKKFNTYAEQKENDAAILFNEFTAFLNA
ncbi:MAG: polysaccharide pyruvyl transferase family protein [Candidatus Wallbacteria bacterium]